MDITADELEERRSPRWTGWLVLGTVGLVTAGAWGATRSLSALATRTEQLEREAAESEARVAELQLEREGLARRVRQLEQEQQRAQAARRAPPARRVGELGARRDAARLALETTLKEERERGTVYLEEAEGELRVGLMDPLLFAPRDTALSPQGEALLQRLAAALNVEGHLVEVASYPDTSPSDLALELSTARAVRVAHQLERTSKLPPERLVALGYGPLKPRGLEPAATPRLELRLVPAPVRDAVRARAVARP
ncbi:OmpA/MotB family protein [Melittangium boletus]|uniref:OmpA/MotB family protein n=1 Tax=Melittangium boletus TaxID=83453 RepID=UPI003DA1F79C